MIRSMTGYCKTELEMGDFICHVEIRSVNHRYLDTKIHMPKQFMYFEETLKKKIKSRINRGKVDTHIQIESVDERKERLKIDQNVWLNVQELIGKFENDLEENVTVHLSDLLNIKDLLVYDQEDLNLESIECVCLSALDKALDDIIRMKEREGEILFEDFASRIQRMTELLDELPRYLSEALDNLKARLKKNLESIGAIYDKDDLRVAQEIGVFVDRSDITEEIERFKSHLTQFTEILQSKEPVGRKLDFILQELNREANTICSKSAHVQITRTGVELKSEIEKVREQAQNIE